VRKKLVGAGFVALALCGVAWRAGAQGPPPRGEFGRRGPGPGGLMDRMFSIEGMMGGFGGRPVAGIPFQFKFTISRTQPVLVNGSASTITSTTTGTLARGDDGSTYRNLKLSEIGPWASSGQAREFTIIRNLATMTEFIVDVAKGTYRSFPIRQHELRSGRGPNPGGHDDGQGKAPDGNASGKGPTRTTITNYAIADHSYVCPNAEKTSFTRSIQLPGSGGNATITSNRIYCTDLKLVVEEDRSDPRFGTTTYQLSGYLAGSNVSFTPDPSFKEDQGKKFRGGPRDGDQPGPPTHPQDRDPRGPRRDLSSLPEKPTKEVPQ
jgi:hypothetical protein